MTHKLKTCASGASNPPAIVENGTVRDEIGNFTRAQIFNEMGPSTQNIQDLRARLRTLGITTAGQNTLVRFDNLMTDYRL